MENEGPQDAVSQKELRQLARDVDWLTRHARETDTKPTRDLLARCTIFAATLAVLLVYCLPWGRVTEDGDFSPPDAQRLTGWQLVDHWDDVDYGLGVFLARFLVITVVLAAIAGLCVLVPMPKAVGLVISLLLWFLTISIGGTVSADVSGLEFVFELTAVIAVIIMGALAASWTWWTSCTEAGWWRPSAG